MSDTNGAPSTGSVETTQPQGASEATEANKQQGPNGAQPTEPAKPQKRKFTYKADGQEITEELDDNELQSKLSLAKAAQKRIQEASSIKKQHEQVMKLLKENPMELLNNEQLMGQKKFREIAEQFLLQQIEQESMSPEQRAQAEMKRRLEQYEQQESQRKQEAEQAQMQKLENHYAEQYEKSIITALEASRLPKTPTTVKRMAQLMAKNLEHGLDLEPAQLAQLVREDYQSELKSLIGDLDAEGLVSMFGDDVANKIRKFDLQRFKLNASSKPKEEPKWEGPKQEPGQRRLSPREYTEMLRNKFVK